MKLRILSLLLLGGLAAGQGVIVGGGDVVYDPKTGKDISCLEKPKNPRQAKLCWPDLPHVQADTKAIKVHGPDWYRYTCPDPDHQVLLTTESGKHWCHTLDTGGAK